ncbi:hypothetical protein M0P48_00530 [Candidatus Gracilibacteria bacterium]|nr:hypothetical protein [Candidatus Gracilibacteria bacterium]
MKEKEEKYLATLSDEGKKKYFKEKRTENIIKILSILFIAGFFISLAYDFSWEFTAVFTGLIGLYFLVKYLFKKHKEKSFGIRFANATSKYKANKKRYLIRTGVVVGALLIISGALTTNSMLKKQKQEMITNYPVPKIEVLSSKDPQGKADKYLLKLKVTDTENLTISHGDTVEKNLSGKSDIVEQEILLLTPKTDISIDAKNIYKTSHESILIERDKNSQELAKEEEEKKNSQIFLIEFDISDKETQISRKQEYIKSFNIPSDEYTRINNLYFAKGNLTLNKDDFAIQVWQKDISQLRSEVNNLKYKLKALK